jgi:hypothetical protein
MSSIDSAERAHRCLRAVWVIVSAMNDDAVAKDVEMMGKRLSSAIEEKDVEATAAAMEEVREWLTTSAGVVLGRLQYVFEPR